MSSQYFRQLAKVADAPYERVEYAKAADEIEKLEAAIRKHRDERGDDRCWMDDEELYRTLPEGYTPPARDTSVELQNCQRFIECRRNPATKYISPQREIERLERRNSELTESEEHLADEARNARWSACNRQDQMAVQAKEIARLNAEIERQGRRLVDAGLEQEQTDDTN